MEQIESFIKHWPRALACMLLGALCGWIAWMFLPQNYTAVARLNVSIDYARTGKLDDLEQDRILGVTEDILHSDDLMQTVFRQSSARDYQQFFKNTQTFRSNKTWSLTITGRDPEETGKLALFWVDSAYDALNECLIHATREDALRNELDGLTRCIQDSASVSASVCPAADELRDRMDLLLEEIRTEQKASCGLSPAIKPGIKHPSPLEIRSASRSAAADTTIGALCGLLVSFAFVWFPKRREQS